MKTAGFSMKPRTYVKKLDEFFSGNKRLNCCDKRVKQDGGDIGLVRRVLTKAAISFLFLFFIIFHFHLSPTFAKPCIFLREKLKREEKCEIRFTSAGELLQGLKSQHILKKSSLIDKLSIVLLPRSDYTRNYEFSFSNLAAVVFASFTNSWLIINQVFPFTRRCSSVKGSFRNWQAPVLCQVYMQALFSFLQISRRSFG